MVDSVRDPLQTRCAGGGAVPVRLLVTPGYFFFGKIISPEYMLLLLSALSLWCLHQDKSSYGAGYAGALFFACLATATKVSAAPLLAVMYAASIVRPLLARQGWKVAVRNGLLGGSLMAVFWLGLVWLCGPQKAWQQMSDALSIVPPTQLNLQVLREVWSRDAVTWDQIMVGGAGHRLPRRLPARADRSFDCNGLAFSPEG